MKKIVFDVGVIVYILLAIVVTVCLLSYNDYNVSEINGNTLIIVKNDNTGSYHKNDLLIVGNDNKYEKNDSVFYYIKKANNYYINYGKIEKIENNNIIIDGEVINKKFLISTDNNVTVLSQVGGILALLESRWGYLCIIILPIFIALLCEIYEIIKELKKSSK